MEPRKDPQSEWQTKIERLIKDAGGREKLPTSAQANTLLKEAPNGGYVLTKSKQGLAISYVWDGNIKLQSVRAKDAASLAVKVVTNIQQWGQSRLLFQPISGAMVDYLLGDVLRVEGDLDNCLKALRAHIEKNTESTNFFQIRQIEIADRSIEELPIQEFQKLIQLILLLLEHGAPLKSVHSQKEAEILSGAVEHFPALIKRCIKESDVKTLDEFCKAIEGQKIMVTEDYLSIFKGQKKPEGSIAKLKIAIEAAIAKKKARQQKIDNWNKKIDKYYNQEADRQRSRLLNKRDAIAALKGAENGAYVLRQGSTGGYVISYKLQGKLEHVQANDILGLATDLVTLDLDERLNTPIYRFQPTNENPPMLTSLSHKQNSSSSNPASSNPASSNPASSNSASSKQKKGGIGSFLSKKFKPGKSG